ncbi:hypothetical protein XELAEV_18041914mg [Xenopus laevis]|uniref:Immunoglobulin domain-containing protein n=1 Tax=Xenopus laevis TaxID=8355 RepID=A0A974C362_XENLA|nr:hypothetical protein XELAEV_18041914mg [Xenopus laevis]
MTALALFIVLVFLGGKTALCDLYLKVSHETQGVRGESVVIPCTYTPSACYTETRRLQVASTHPGDVSLTIRNLKTIERGNYKCVVTWKSSDGLTVIKEGFSKLLILRATIYSSAKQPDVAVFSTKGSIRDSSEDATENAKLDFINKGSGVPIYFTLFIVLVCAHCIFTLIIVFITRQKKTMYYRYDMPIMSQLAVRLDGSTPLAYGGYLSFALPNLTN